MADGDRFPLEYPGDVRPTFVGEGALRRVARALLNEVGVRVLSVGTGGGAIPLYLAREMGCTVVVADTNDAALEQVRERARAQNVADRVTVRTVADLAKLPFSAGEFNAIYVDPWVPQPFDDTLRALRPLLAPKGRICVTYPVRVGRHVNPTVGRFWEEKLGEPLVLPRDLLQRLERAGYEPQTVESLEDHALEDFYRRVEAQLGTTPPDRAAKLREEIALFRSQAGRSTASFAVAVGRRKEPGEKPPPSRNE